MRRADTGSLEQGRPERTRSRRPHTEVEQGREADSLAGGLLGLQRSVGNRVVSSLLMRDEKEPEQMDASDKAASATLIMPDPIGVIPVESFQTGDSSNGRGGIGSGGSGTGKASITSVSVVLPSTAFDAKFYEYSAKGVSIPSVVLSTAFLRIVITDAIISAVSQRGEGGLLSITINGTIAIENTHP